MARKKSGEVVKSSLKSPGRSRPCSVPSTPTFPSKNVHFDSRIEHVRHFLHSEKPSALSVGSSPVEGVSTHHSQSIPKFARTVLDAVQDELFNPGIAPGITRSQPEHPSETNPQISWLFQQAQSQHVIARSTLVMPTAVMLDHSPFRANSPFHPARTQQDPQHPNLFVPSRDMQMTMTSNPSPHQQKKQEEPNVSPLPLQRHQTGLRGSLNGVNTDIFADSGSAWDIITESFAFERGIPIDKSTMHHRKIRFSNGKFFRVVGKATATWKFMDDPVPHDVTFDVVSKCIHGVLFGSAFLQKTQSLTRRFAHRLVNMRNWFGKHILSVSNIGTIHQQLPVIAHGKYQSMHISALPDTGAEGNIISEERFRRSRLTLEPTDTAFMFPDGTVERSLGRVRMGLSFEDNAAERTYAYFEVMRRCQHDMILGHDFVFENDVYEDDMTRLVDTAAEMGINLVIFIKAKQDPEKLEEQRRRLEVSRRHQEIACAERARRFATVQTNGIPNLMAVSVLPIPNEAGIPDSATTGGQPNTALHLSPDGNAPTFLTTQGGRWRRFRELLRRVSTV